MIIDEYRFLESQAIAIIAEAIGCGTYTYCVLLCSCSFTFWGIWRATSRSLEKCTDFRGFSTFEFTVDRRVRVCHGACQNVKIGNSIEYFTLTC